MTPRTDDRARLRRRAEIVRDATYPIEPTVRVDPEELLALLDEAEAAAAPAPESEATAQHYPEAMDPLLMAGLTFRSGQRLADHPELVEAIEAEASAAVPTPNIKSTLIGGPKVRDYFATPAQPAPAPEGLTVEALTAAMHRAGVACTETYGLTMIVGKCVPMYHEAMARAIIAALRGGAA